MWSLAFMWFSFQVLISGKEEPDAKVSPAMNAVIKVFKRVNGLPEDDSDGAGLASTVASMCSIRLLVASTQAIYIIGKQGNLIKSIQENSGAQVRVLSTGMLKEMYLVDDFNLMCSRNFYYLISYPSDFILFNLDSWFFVDETFHTLNSVFWI